MTAQQTANAPPSHLPLETLELPALPLNTHNIAWSPDLELAVGADDSVYIFLPHFSALSPADSSGNAGLGPKRQYHEIALHFPATEARSPEINRRLFDAVAKEFPEIDEGVYPSLNAGQGPIARTGGTLNHVVALAWSPCGLGRMKRSVLAVLTGNGTIAIYCESSLPSNAPSLAIRGRKARTLRPLLVPWCVGNGCHVPVTAAGQAASSQEDSLPHNLEYITSMAWAQQLHAPSDGALLAYMTDDDEVVILAVQAQHGTLESGHGPGGDWRVEEVARFFAGGPHPLIDPLDPDFVPFGTPFALKWSPWIAQGGSKTSLVSYISRNYVGFRRVTIQDNWASMESPAVDVGSSDVEGMCQHLATDAFVTWEDKVWEEQGNHILRGIVASPFSIQAFQIPLNSDGVKEQIPPHMTEHCGTTYAPVGVDRSLNPITGLVIHSSSTLEQNPTPLFSLVRLAATHLNDDWYQTNLPLASDAKTRPAWATDILHAVGHNLPRSLAYLPRKSFAADDSDPEEESDEDEDYEDWDPEAFNEDFAGDLGPVKPSEDAMSRVHTTRMRIWGLLASPGGGSMAVFATEHDTIKPERSTFAGLRCKILFGQTRHADSDGQDGVANNEHKLSTEAQAWDWMYGGGSAPPGTNAAIYDFGSDMLKSRLMDVSAAQKCPFCDASVIPTETHSRCTSGHTFETCAATGVPILEPGISNTCGVCSSKCLRVDVLDKMLVQLPQRQEILAMISPTFCGRCGGKFED
ncbi:transcription factor IIIC subunit delta N-term-domain-containing protein [Microdochium bolleyi]|uniref:Transcription factor IIIC subunit delta N-term-domain-containing protein n=1 Tax=Microdochium bolleyi TaxID=196109 RepID=A0A136ITI6_9PEZI|nr:transcription factor IIIC subunit delta N-term-domain-containing protein [Microdochium bolleyi]